VELAAGTGLGMPRRGVRGPAAAVDLALRAYTAAVHGADDDAVALLAQAQAATVTPLHQALTAIAGIVVASRTGAALGVEPFGSELFAVVGTAGLRWPLMLLGEGDRAVLVAALGSGTARTAIREALSTVPPAVTEGLWTQAQVPRLTPGEVTVLHQLARTAVRAQIAAALHVSINTVKAQLGSLYAKLGVRSREDALTRAVALGLLVTPEVWDIDPSDGADPSERADTGDVPR
jgi:LuxR family maltose regulon positive regulatory protein